MKKAILLLVALGVVAALSGQTITGDLVVSVTDPSGGAVAGATLSLTQIETNVKLSARSDSLGSNLFSQLKPGPYTLEVSAPGFQKANVTGIVIAIGQRAHVDAKLTVGAVNETVNVTAESPLLENSPQMIASTSSTTVVLR